jgi:hypothetical protein
VIQALLIMGGNSKNSDEIREKSTRAILVTQAVNALGYSILASFFLLAASSSSFILFKIFSGFD